MTTLNNYGNNRLSLKDILNSFCEKGLPQEERQKLILSKDGQQEIPATFAEIAKCILCGCFSVESGKSEVKIIPTAIEFYYHEEDDVIKDEIVYHKNSDHHQNRPFFKVGFFNSHDSGIDLTFESPKEMKNFRASVLIREFKVIDSNSNDVLELKEIDDRSTYFRKALLSQFSLFDGFKITWEDWRINPDEWSIGTDVRVGVRKNEDKGIDGKQAARPWKCFLKSKASNN